VGDGGLASRKLRPPAKRKCEKEGCQVQSHADRSGHNQANRAGATFSGTGYIVRWLPDRKRIVFSGNQAGHPRNPFILYPEKRSADAFHKQLI